MLLKKKLLNNWIIPVKESWPGISTASKEAITFYKKN